MVVRKHILATLNNLEIKYNSALSSPDYKEPIYISKLALLEYCGWLEETIDIIARRAIKNKLTRTEIIQSFESIVSGTYGFEYKKYFRPLLTKTIGIVNINNLEVQLDRNGSLSTLISELDSIWGDRGHAAHSWVTGMKTYPAPSNIKNKLLTVYPILKEIYCFIISL